MARLLLVMLDRGVSPSDVGVICLYKAQVSSSCVVAQLMPGLRVLVVECSS